MSTLLQIPTALLWRSQNQKQIYHFSVIFRKREYLNSSMSLSRGDELSSTLSRPMLWGYCIIIHATQRRTKKGTVRLGLGSNICLWRTKTTSNFIGVLEQMGNSPERGGLGHGLEHRLVDDGMEKLFSCSVMFDSLQPQGLQHARLPCPLPSPIVCSNSCPLSW